MSDAEIERLGRVLHPQARRLARTRADAEDLVQDTLLILFKRIQAGAVIENPQAYANRILRNRARRAWLRTPEAVLVEADNTYAPNWDAWFECAEVLERIEALPPVQRRLMRLVAAGETSPRALAKETGAPVNTVMSRLARARASLRLKSDP